MPIIKNKFSLLFLLIVLISGLFFVSSGQSYAVGAAYFSEDTTVTTDATDVVIVANSQADTVQTTSTTITVTISAGQSLTVKSTSRKLLNVDGYYTSKTCTTSESTVVITPPTGSETLTITPQSSNCADTSNSSGGGSTGGGGGITVAVATPTPTPTPIPGTTVSPTVSPEPMTVPVSTSKSTPASRGFTSLAAVSLKDGDVVSAAGSSDPDIYIVNPHGYKRLFLNPAIFNFYGHLGGFSKVKGTTSVTRDIFVTSGLFRNCETNDKKVYGVETTGEDSGILHWVNTSGEQAVADDPNFFKKVFCINTKEFTWYPQGAAYTSVNQIPDYTRKNTPASVVISSAKKYKVSGTTELNVRATASTSGALLGKIPEGQIIESLGQQGLWHKIKYQSKDGWVHSDYLKAI